MVTHGLRRSRYLPRAAPCPAASHSSSSTARGPLRQPRAPLEHILVVLFMAVFICPISSCVTLSYCTKPLLFFYFFYFLFLIFYYITFVILFFLHSFNFLLKSFQISSLSYLLSYYSCSPISPRPPPPPAPPPLLRPSFFSSPSSSSSFSPSFLHPPAPLSLSPLRMRP